MDLVQNMKVLCNATMPKETLRWLDRHKLQTKHTHNIMYTILPPDHGTSGDQAVANPMPAAAALKMPGVVIWLDPIG